LARFNALEAGFYRNLTVLRNLEAKFLKTAKLRRLAGAMEPDGTPRIYAENTPLKTG
jgi:hypothetical protein